MNTNTIKVYEILKDYWGEKKASVVLDYLENETTIKVKKAVENKIEHLATREDIFKLEKATREDILKLETSIVDKYANTIKWMFIFWIGTMGTIIAIIKLL